MSRICVKNPDKSCYVCGELTVKAQGHSVTLRVKRSYELYFGCKLTLSPSYQLWYMCKYVKKVAAAIAIIISLCSTDGIS